MAGAMGWGIRGQYGHETGAMIAGVPVSLVIPLVAVASGRWWSLLMVMPITLVPIAGKTIRTLVYQAHVIGPAAGWMIYGVLPVFVSTAVALWYARQPGCRSSGREFARAALLVNVWLYFGLNFAFVRFPWPWRSWTTRTPNSVVFFICAVGLTVACWRIGRRQTGEGLPRVTSAG